MYVYIVYPLFALQVPASVPSILGASQITCWGSRISSKGLVLFLAMDYSLCEIEILIYRLCVVYL